MSWIQVLENPKLLARRVRLRGWKPQHDRHVALSTDVEKTRFALVLRSWLKLTKKEIIWSPTEFLTKLVLDGNSHRRTSPNHRYRPFWTRPMAPHNRVSAQHSDTVHRHVHARNAAFDASSDAVNDELFLEPMMGTPLAIYIEKDVADRDQLVEIITVCIPSAFGCLNHSRSIFASETWWDSCTGL